MYLYTWVAYSIGEYPAHFPSYVVLGKSMLGVVGQLFDGDGKILAQTGQCVGFLSLADCGTLRPGAGYQSDPQYSPSKFDVSTGVSSCTASNSLRCLGVNFF